MNHYVPDYEMDDNRAMIATSSALTRPRKSFIASEDEIMELIWQNGQVVVQNQTQMSHKKSPHNKYDDVAVLPVDHQSSPIPREIRPSQLDHDQNRLFIQEDDMAPWLHYPLNDTNFEQEYLCADLLYPSAACVTTATSAAAVTNTSAAPHHNPQSVPAPRPPIPPARRAEVVKNFAYFSRHRARGVGESSELSNSFKPVVRESTVVDSSVTPVATGSESRISETAVGRSVSAGDNACGTISGGAAAAGTSSIVGGCNNSSNREMVTCEMTVTSSPGGSSASASAEAAAAQKPQAEDRKRKRREEETQYHSEDVEFESPDAKKQAHSSTSTKRSRAAEVHNLSERRRRDRINEKMRALQELIPRCNKSDKASMLDEAIEYLKSLQLQVQMMSMGCSMVPMMFPGIQQYMPPLGIGMGMGMGMEMGMNRPLMPFPSVLAGAPLPTPAAAAHLGPRFSMPAFHVPPVPVPAPASALDPSRIRGTNQSDPMLLTISTQNPNQPRIPNFTDPYQQYIGLQQMQIPVSQNQAMTQPGTSKRGSSQGVENLDNHQSGT